ncbi:MAG: hypothetical protein Q8R57_09195 [Bacteroidota bacterium]|nr:hypothetical protein [Bacteroidota bacterium]
MEEGFYTENIWEMISNEAKLAKGKSYVSVPYFGEGASKKLPLKKGSLLVVNAEKQTIATAGTSPNDLISLKSVGVEIHSNALNHSKIYVVNNTLFVGSANATNNSSENLKEAIWVSKNKIEIEKAIAFIKSLKVNPIGDEQLISLSKIYNTKKTENWNYNNENKPLHNNVFVWVVDYDNYSDGFEEAADKLYKEVKKIRKSNKTHRIDEIESDTICETGINVMQVYKNKGKFIIYPIGSVLGFKPFTNDEKTISFAIMIEVSRKRRGINIDRLGSQFTENELKELKQDGKLSNKLAQKFIDYWNK